MALFDVPARLWTLARKVEDVLALQSKMREALEAIDGRLRDLETRMTRLEAERNQVVSEAKGAAMAAAAQVSGGSVAEIVTRLTRLEVQHEGMAARLPPNGPSAALSKPDGNA